MKIDFLEIDFKNERCRIELGDASYISDSFGTWKSVLEAAEFEEIDCLKIAGYSSDKESFKEAVRLGVRKASKLDLSYNSLKEDAVLLVSLMKESGVLTKIDFTNNGIKTSGSALVSGLAEMPLIREVNLSDNWLKSLDHAAVLTLIGHEDFSKLDLSSNLPQLAGEFQDHAFESIIF